MDKTLTASELKLAVLQALNFGSRTAEEEADVLSTYFVQTDQWKRMLRGEIDVVYGAKGAGKSAIYTLLDKSRDALFSSNIITTTAENPRGATIFRNIVSDPPVSERDFINFWKIYIIGLLGQKFQEYDLSNERAKTFIFKLQELKLFPEGGGLLRLFRAAREFAVRHILRQAKTVTWTATTDPVSGFPMPRRTAEYDTSEKMDDDHLLDNFNADEILEIANEALVDEGFKCWILFDRLDVAFEESKDLERNALRALFRVYNDLKNLSNVNLKIFVRDDIWRRITEKGFAEASHITRTVTIKWDTESLLNLTVRRLMSNKAILGTDAINLSEIIGNLEQQRRIFYVFSQNKLILDQISRKHSSGFLVEQRMGQASTRHVN